MRGTGRIYEKPCIRNRRGCRTHVDAGQVEHAARAGEGILHVDQDDGRPLRRNRKRFGLCR